MVTDKEAFRQNSHGAFCRKEVMCPECRTDRTIKWRKGVKRFRAKKYRCGHCGFIGRCGEWDAWDVDEWLDELGGQ